ncbi:hypothetical protein GCM10020258_01460 [Sphingomonas yabuuchiae]
MARDQIAALLPSGGRVVFTSGATEALNWAIKGTGGGIVTTAIEHAAVLDTAAATGRPLTLLPVDGEGLVAAGPDNIDKPLLQGRGWGGASPRASRLWRRPTSKGEG